MDYTYRLISSLAGTDVIQRIEDATFIPSDLAKTSYQEYLAWLAEGNEPLPADN